jgi:hypothetical protein
LQTCLSDWQQPSVSRGQSDREKAKVSCHLWSLLPLMVTHRQQS